MQDLTLKEQAFVFVATLRSICKGRKNLMFSGEDFIPSSLTFITGDCAT